MSRSGPPQAPGTEEHSKAQGITQQADRKDDGHTIEADVSSHIIIGLGNWIWGCGCIGRTRDGG